MQIKQAITGYGGADKIQMQRMVKALLGMQEIAARTTPPTRWPWR